MSLVFVSFAIVVSPVLFVRILSSLSYHNILFFSIFVHAFLRFLLRNVSIELKMIKVFSKIDDYMNIRKSEIKRDNKWLLVFMNN